MSRRKNERKKEVIVSILKAGSANRRDLAEWFGLEEETASRLLHHYHKQGLLDRWGRRLKAGSKLYEYELAAKGLDYLKVKGWA